MLRQDVDANSFIGAKHNFFGANIFSTEKSKLMFFRRILSVGVRVPLGRHDRADAERHLREVVVLDERDGGGLGGGRFGGHGGSVDTAGSGAVFGEEGFFLSFLWDFGGAAAASAAAAAFATASASAMAGGNSRRTREERIARAHGLAFDEAVERGARVGLAHTHLREELGALLGHHARED